MSVRDPLSEETSPAGTNPQVVAAFDFDGTLTRGGSVWKFLVSVAGRRRVLQSGLLDLPKLLTAAVFGGSANDSAKEALYRRLLAGRDAREISELATKFGLSHFRSRVRPEVRDRLEWHLAQGHRVVVVSASPELYIRPVAAELGADAVIGTRLEVGEDGDLTGRYEGKNCRAAEKERRLREWISDTVVSTASRSAGDARVASGGADAPVPFVWAYGNSAGDLEMLRNADVGVNVGRLGKLGKLRGFRSLASVLASVQPGDDAAPTTPPR